VGAGLTPREVISVESNGIPAGPTDPLELIPSGVVSCRGGVAVVGSSTCAKAGLASNNEATATINVDRTKEAAPDRPLRMRRSALVCRDLAALISISSAAISSGARLSDIGQSLSVGEATFVLRSAKSPRLAAADVRVAD
jgi:hypothetical protein